MSAQGAGSEQRAWLLTRQGRHELAEQEWRAVLSAAPEHAIAHANLALCLAHRERWVDAGAEADLAVGLAPDADYVHYVRANVLYARNRFAEAAESIAEAIRLDPEDAHHRALLGEIRAAQRDWKAALAAADEGLAIDAEHVRCLNLRAAALIQVGRKAEAAETIAGALARSPDNSHTHANHGWARLHANRPGEALDHFREALRLDPNHEGAREGLLMALKAQNPVYRAMLAFFLFMSRLRTTHQWLVVIGVIAANSVLRNQARAHPEWGIVLWPLIAAIGVFCYLTWLADPLMNLLLRTNRFGRLALSDDQRMQSSLVGGAIVLAGGVFLIEWWLGNQHTLSFMFLLYSLPLATIHQCDQGWPRRIAIIVAAALGAVALYVLLAKHYAMTLFMLFGEAGLIMVVYAMKLAPAYVIGILFWSLAANVVMQVRPKR